jgi:hypothetical protein
MKLNLMSDTRFKKSNIESCEIEVDKMVCGLAGQSIGSKARPRKHDGPVGAEDRALRGVCGPYGPKGLWPRGPIYW